MTESQNRNKHLETSNGTGVPFPADSRPAPPLVEELSPAPDPWEVCRRLSHLPRLLFLDSAAGPAALGRYSYVTAAPRVWLWSHGRRVFYGPPPAFAKAAVERDADPFSEVARILSGCPMQTAQGLPPFQGGIAGLWGYDLCHHIERLPRPGIDEFGVPEMAVGLYDWVVAFDHAEGRCWVISTGLPRQGAERTDEARRRLRQVKRWLDVPPRPTLSQGSPVTPALVYPLPGMPGVFSNFDREDYLRAARKAIDYVHAGDCFQVNLAQRLLAPAALAPLELYGRLRERNPAPFAGYLDLGDFAVASASPERFLKVTAGEVETRPIKGTRPCGTTPEEDEVRQRELLESAKDRAENVMIVDLLRNDLGRVCAYGSVRVEAVCRLETYRYVHHLVSEVRGRLREGRGPVDLLRAAFPGGSVTGAPKVRAMEIIAELEPTVRGPYCGALGYIGFDGSMDANLLIRTFTAGRGWVQFPVGGGIVADSTPEGEYAETLHKAEGLLRALR
jgi:para-aminobenzoate synthetase component I